MVKAGVVRHVTDMNISSNMYNCKVDGVLHFGTFVIVHGVRLVASIKTFNPRKSIDSYVEQLVVLALNRIDV